MKNIKNDIYNRKKKIIFVIFISILAALLIAFITKYAGTTTGKNNKNNEDTTESNLQKDRAEIKGEKKAIIILPGITESILYDKDTSKAVWSFENSSDSINTVYALENTDPASGFTLACDDKGIPYYNFSVPKPGEFEEWDNAISKGTLGDRENIRPLADELRYRYSDKYDVFVWQYDWRLSNQKSAEQLEQYINEKGYEKVILIAHSMGGNVCSIYMANSQTNTDKVEMFIPVSSPLLGTPTAAVMIINPAMGNSIFGGINYIDTFTSVFDLFPNKEYTESMQFADGNSYITMDGNNIGYDEFMQNFKLSVYGKNTNGNVKPMIEDFEQIQNKVIVDGKHISQYVNTQYIQGKGIKTITGIDTDDSQISGISVTTNNEGDGTVPLYSGICNLDPNSENVHIVNNVEHGQMLSCEETIGIITGLLDSLIK